MFGIKSIKIAPDAEEDATAAKSGSPAASKAVDDRSRKADADASGKGGDIKTTGSSLDTAIVIFGRDDGGKAHGSRFSQEDREVAIKAAHLMGFTALAVQQDAVRTIAGILPEGRVFDSGKAFVPFVKAGHCIALEAHAKQFPGEVLRPSQAVLDELAKLAAVEESNAHADAATQPTPSAEADTQAGSDKAGKSSDLPSELTLPSQWPALTKGSHVVAVDDPDDGWWVAKMVNLHRSGVGKTITTMLTLKWVDSPEDPTFVRRANEVAYFHPAYQQETLSEDQA